MKRLLAAMAVSIALAGNVSAEETAVGHMVFFQLKENTPENRKKLVDACYKYLKDHDGVLYFSAGPRADAVKEPVSAADWDVALHIVFKDKKSLEKYGPHPQHQKFIEENKAMWKGVKVYDSHLDVDRK